MPADRPRIRPARRADAAAITRIRNDAVDNGVALWTRERAQVAAVETWLRRSAADGRPLLVAEVGGAVAGYGSYGPWRPQTTGYLHTVEDSIYIDAEHRGAGLGSALLGAVVEHARTAGHHVMVADIEAGNAASIALHERHGFAVQGTLTEVGTKFGRWLDLTLMTLRLSNAPAEPDDPVRH